MAIIGYRFPTKHGMSKSRTFLIWKSMIFRCSSKRIANYGGRGIKVCARWKVFLNFLADMGEAPDGLQIERIDNDGNYEPGNCRWATRKEQARNRRTNRNITINGRTQCLADWSLETGIPQIALYQRIVRYRWPLEEAISRPLVVRGPRRRQQSKEKA